jgi:glycosyltransferase involved in cell wall biosynthesis
VLWIDVTDIVEFLASGTTVSGVQRVSANLTPLLLTDNSSAVILDRSRGVFVALTDKETHQLIRYGVSSGVAAAREPAQACIERAATAQPAELAQARHSTIVALGAIWINDQLMSAIRQAVSEGVNFVDLFYDLTPVLDAGHSTHLRPLFERYLALLSDCANRVPAISHSSRNDLVNYCQQRNWRVPPGVATGLPSGLAHLAPTNQEPENSLDPYVLMVGTIEARKNHLLAFNVWQRLVEKHGPGAIPTLIVVGKKGWNADDFLETLQKSNNLNGKIELRTDSVTDEELAQLYRDAQFTIYPSDYEGWGLPVTESIHAGTPVVAANNSSLPEAGGDLTCYFNTGDLDDFVSVIETQMLNPENYTTWKAKITQNRPLPITWSNIADLIDQEIDAVRDDTPSNPPQLIPELTQWTTYPLSAPHTEFTDRLLVGDQRPPQPWGFPIFRDQTLRIRFTHPADAHLTVHLGTLCEAGIVSIEINGSTHAFSRGEFVSIPLGAIQANQHIELVITATDVGPSDQGFIGLTSITVEGETTMVSEQSENLNANHKACQVALSNDLAGQ